MNSQKKEQGKKRETAMGYADTMKPESGPQFGRMLKINEVVAQSVGKKSI